MHHKRTKSLADVKASPAPLVTTIKTLKVTAAGMEALALRKEVAFLKTQIEEKSRHCAFMLEMWEDAQATIEFLKSQCKRG